MFSSLSFEQKRNIKIIAIAIIAAIIIFIFIYYGIKRKPSAPTPTITETKQLNNIVPAGLTASGQVTFFDANSKSLKEYSQTTGSESLAVQDVIPAGESFQNIIYSPDKSKAVVKAINSSTNLPSVYVYDLQAKTRALIPPVEDLIWKGNSDLYNLEVDSSGTASLNVYSVANSQKEVSYPLSSVILADHLLGYDSNAKAVYFFEKVIPSDYEPQTMIPDLVNLLVFSEVDQSITTLASNLNPLAVAYIGDKVFFEQSGSVYTIDSVSRTASLFFSGLSSYPFNIENCDGSADEIYCTILMSTSDIRFARIKRGDSQPEFIAVQGTLFMGKVNLIQKEPLSFYIYNEFNKTTKIFQ